MNFLRKMVKTLAAMAAGVLLCVIIVSVHGGMVMTDVLGALYLIYLCPLLWIFFLLPGAGSEWLFGKGLYTTLGVVVCTFSAAAMIFFGTKAHRRVYRYVLVILGTALWGLTGYIFMPINS